MTFAVTADAALPRLAPPALRRARLAALLAGIFMLPSAPAAAQDFLRGSVLPSYSRWQGVYFGLSASESFGHADFGSGTSDLVAFILRNTTIENEGHVSQWNTSAPASGHFGGFGGFIGYNFQISPDLVVGFDAGYTKLRSNAMSSSDSESRSFMESNGNYRANVTVNTNMSISLQDYATFRARAGYVAGQFLPYAFVGAAVARGTLDRTATVFASEVPVPGPGATLTLNPNPTISNDHRNFTNIGGTAGIGFEVAVLPNMFLRAEYEFVALSPVSGTRLYMHTGRVGIGLKF